MTNPNPARAVPDDAGERNNETTRRAVAIGDAIGRGRWLPFATLALLASLTGQPYAVYSHLPGTLANPGFEGQPMKSVYFFAGEWRLPGLTYYDGVTPASNHCLYTVFPSDGRTHLGWSERPDKREHAVNLMLAAGVNVVTMSYWGPPGTDRWAFWAPMQTATGAHNELFDTAVAKPVLITPSIESSLATAGKQQHSVCGNDDGPIGQSPGFDFLDAFPGTPENPAPELVAQIVDLVNRYLRDSTKPEWRDHWTQLYDRDGRTRYVIDVIHAGSNQPGVTDEAFAHGFTWAADRVHRETGVRVGFVLDVLPEEHNARFKPTPARTGPLLAEQAAVLAIQPFNPEIFTGRCRVGEDCDAVGGSPQLTELVAWKQRFVSNWVSTGIPVILDVSPGHDARYVFPARLAMGTTTRGAAARPICCRWAYAASSPTRGTDTRKAMRSYLRAAMRLLPGFRGALIVQAPKPAYLWFKDMTPPGGTHADRLPATLAGTIPSSAVYSDPIALTFELKSFNLAQALFDAPDPLPRRRHRRPVCERAWRADQPPGPGRLPRLAGI